MKQLNAVLQARYTQGFEGDACICEVIPYEEQKYIGILAEVAHLDDIEVTLVNEEPSFSIYNFLTETLPKNDTTKNSRTAKKVKMLLSELDNK